MAAAPPPQPAAYRETPEQTLAFLRQRFNIPAKKADCDPDQEQKWRALNKAVVKIIQDVTKNPANKKLIDLKTEEDQAEFMRLAHEITWSVNDGTFNVLAF